MGGSCPLAVVEQNIYQVKPVVSIPYHQGSNTPSFNTASPLCFFVLKLPSASLNVLFSSNSLFIQIYFSCQLITISSFSTALMTTLNSSHLASLHEFSCDFILSMSPTHAPSPFLSSSSLSHTHTLHTHTYIRTQTVNPQIV